jgi:hypothetical protein
MSIYFPLQSKYYKAAYDGVEGLTKWREMLKAYQDAGAAIPTGERPQFTNPDHAATVQWTGSTLIVEGELASGTAANVVSVGLYYGVVEAGSLYLIGDRVGSIEGNKATGNWATTVLIVSQDTAQSYAYLSEVPEQGAIQASIPFSYYAQGSASGEPVLLTMIIDGTSGTILQSNFYLITAGGLGELYPQPGATIRPVVMQISAGKAQWVELTTVFDPTQQMNFALQLLPAGTEAYVELDVIDYGGNFDYVAWQQVLN